MIIPGKSNIFLIQVLHDQKQFFLNIENKSKYEWKHNLRLSSLFIDLFNFAFFCILVYLLVKFEFIYIEFIPQYTSIFLSRRYLVWTPVGFLSSLNCFLLSLEFSLSFH